MLKNRTVVKANWEDPFSSLLAETEFQMDLISKVVISKHESFVDPVHTVPLDAPVLLCSQFNCLYVCFYLESDNVSCLTPVTYEERIKLDTCKLHYIMSIRLKRERRLFYACSLTALAVHVLARTTDLFNNNAVAYKPTIMIFMDMIILKNAM